MSPSPIRPTIQTHAGEPDDQHRQAMGRRFRDALARWASGVGVLAVTDGEEIDAITVSAFSALSSDPPLVLVCVGENSSLIPSILEVGRFTVSVLAEDARPVASRIANRMPLDGPEFAPTGDPVLEGSLAGITCRLWKTYPGGDHRIIIGEAERVDLPRDAPPLLYFRRAYRALSEET